MDHRKLLHLLLALSVVGCGEPTMTPSDGSVPGTDGGAGFDPSMTYPGEGDSCEFSLFCGESQVCVDFECQRHERFTSEDLVVGEPLRIPHEMLRMSSLYTEAPFDWDGGHTPYGLLGATVPMPDGPTLLTWFYSYDGICQVAILGSGRPRVVAVEGLSCTAATLAPSGHLALGGVDTVADSDPPTTRFVVLDQDGAIVADGSYGDDLRATVESGFAEPGAVLWTPTSFLWDGDRFLFSASTSLPPSVDEAVGEIEGVPTFPTHTFFGELFLDGMTEAHEVAGAAVHRGSYGWLVRDGSGVHSIMAVYDEASAPSAPRGARVDVMALETGDREAVAEGASGIAGIGRYSQPGVEQWFLSVFPFPDYCSATLYSGLHVEGSTDLSTPLCSSGPAAGVYAPLGYGSSEIFGPVQSGHPTLGWIDMALEPSATPGDDSYTVQFRAVGAEPWAPTVLPNEPDFSHQVVSRYRKTLEIFGAHQFPVQSQLLVWEARLSRRMP